MERYCSVLLTGLLGGNTVGSGDGWVYGCRCGLLGASLGELTMARPRVRTEVVPEEQVEVLKEVFGSRSNAYRNLDMGGVMSPGEFRQAWYGRECHPGTAEVLEAAWGRWLERRLEARRQVA